MALDAESSPNDSQHTPASDPHHRSTDQSILSVNNDNNNNYDHEQRHQPVPSVATPLESEHKEKGNDDHNSDKQNEHVTLQNNDNDLDDRSQNEKQQERKKKKSTKKDEKRTPSSLVFDLEDATSNVPFSYVNSKTLSAGRSNGKRKLSSYSLLPSQQQQQNKKKNQKRNNPICLRPLADRAKECHDLLFPFSGDNSTDSNKTVKNMIDKCMKVLEMAGIHITDDETEEHGKKLSTRQRIDKVASILGISMHEPPHALDYDDVLRHSKVQTLLKILKFSFHMQHEKDKKEIAELRKELSELKNGVEDRSPSKGNTNKSASKQKAKKKLTAAARTRKKEETEQMAEHSNETAKSDLDKEKEVPNSTTNATNTASVEGSGAKNSSVVDEEQKYVSWADRFHQLLHFQRGYNHCRVPMRYKPNPQLARWVALMRALYRRNEITPNEEDIPTKKDGNVLTQDRINQLNSIGFEWSAIKYVKTSWDDRFNELVEYKEKYGHTRVPRDYNKHLDSTLGEWCHTQRVAYKRQDKKMKNDGSSERVAKLNSIGFEWVAEWRSIKTWEERYEQLAEYRRMYGHVNIPPPRDIGDKGGEQDLGEGSEGEKKDECNGGNNVNEGTAEMTTLLTGSEERALSRWVQNQRAEYFKMNMGKKSTMNRTRAKKLEELGFDWDEEAQLNAHRAREATYVPWETRIEQLLLFKASNNHLKIPQKYRGEQNLGTWASNVRVAFRKWSRGEKFPGNFTKENFDQLQGLGFDFDLEFEPNRRMPWKERYMQLVEYKNQKGDTRVPQLWSGNPQLATWVNEQRRHYRMKQQGKQNFITPERITLLEEIGFEWSVQQAILKQRVEKQQTEPTHDEVKEEIEATEEAVNQAEVLQEVYPAQTDPAVPLLPPHQEYIEQQGSMPPPPPPLQAGYVEYQQQNQAHPTEYTTEEHSAFEGYVEQLTPQQGYPAHLTPHQGGYPDPNANQPYPPHTQEQNYGGQTFGNEYYQL